MEDSRKETALLNARFFSFFSECNPQWAEHIACQSACGRWVQFLFSLGVSCSL